MCLLSNANLIKKMCKIRFVQLYVIIIQANVKQLMKVGQQRESENLRNFVPRVININIEVSLIEERQ